MKKRLLAALLVVLMVMSMFTAVLAEEECQVCEAADCVGVCDCEDCHGPQVVRCECGECDECVAKLHDPNCDGCIVCKIPCECGECEDCMAKWHDPECDGCIECKASELCGICGAILDEGQCSNDDCGTKYNYTVNLPDIGFYDGEKEGLEEGKYYPVAYHIYKLSDGQSCSNGMYCNGETKETVTTQVYFNGKNNTARVSFNLNNYEPGTYCIHAACSCDVSGVLIVEQFKNGCALNKNVGIGLTLGDDGVAIASTQGKAYNYGFGKHGGGSNPKGSLTIKKLIKHDEQDFSYWFADKSFTFTLTNKDNADENYTITATVNSDRIITYSPAILDNLTPGEYYIEETEIGEPPPGYIFAGCDWDDSVTKETGYPYRDIVTVVANKTVTVTATNRYYPDLPGSLEIVKEIEFVDDEGDIKDFAGAEFTFTVTRKGSSWTKTITATVGADGTMTYNPQILENLESGKYTISEPVREGEPADYTFKGVNFAPGRDFTITSNGEAIVITAVNTYEKNPPPDPESGSLKIVKNIVFVDGAGDIQDFEGAEFTFAVTGELDPQDIYEIVATVGEGGVITYDPARLDGLEDGTAYVITETRSGEPTEKYTFKDVVITPAKVTIEAGITAIVNATNSYEPKTPPADPDPIDLTIIKVDSENYDITLKGAVFELTGDALEAPVRAVSGEGGVFEFKGLTAGEYILEEISAPEGYTMPTPNSCTILIEPNESNVLVPYLKAGEDMRWPLTGKVYAENDKIPEDPDTASLTVAKVFSGLPDNLRPEIRVTVYKKTDYLSTDPPTAGENREIFDTITFNSTNGWSKTFNNIEPGVYTVEEDTANAAVSGYNFNGVTYTVYGRTGNEPAVVEIGGESNETVTLTNSYTRRTTTTITNTTPPTQEIPDETPPTTVTEPPVVTEPPIEIPDDPEVPLAPAPPIVELPDPVLPLAPGDGLTDIADDDVPLSDAPRTSDNKKPGGLWSLLAMSALGTALLVLTGKKKEEESEGDAQ